MSEIEFKVYAIVGQNIQQVGGECPEGWIEMIGQRPEDNMVAASDGTWVYPEPEIPTSCSPIQGLVALFSLKNITEDDILAQIDLITNPVDRYKVKLSYQKATVWERETNPVQAIKTLMGLTDQDLDDIFTYAVTVQV